MRRLLFWLHLGAGLTAGVVIALMSLTGALLTYEKQVTAWADGYKVEPPPPGRPVSVEALLRGAQAAHPSSSPSSVTVHVDPSRPAAVSLGRDGTLFMNPFTAEPFGQGNVKVRDFFRSVTAWHRWLALEGSDRSAGRAITGASNLLFLLLVMSGLFLWWPRSWTPASLKAIVLFRSGVSGKARDFNWHNVIGFWSCVPLFFVVATAVVISYPWASDLLYVVTGSEPPPRPSVRTAPLPGPTPREAPKALDTTGLDAAWAVASAHAPGWRTLSLRVPESPKGDLVFSIDTSTGAIRPDLRSQLVVARGPARVIRHETYAAQIPGRRLRTWARFTHTGEAFGLAGQSIAGVVSAGSLLLVWTGFALSWRRFRAYRARTLESRTAPDAGAGIRALLIDSKVAEEP